MCVALDSGEQICTVGLAGGDESRLTWRGGGGATRVCRDARGAIAREADDAMDARRLNGLGEGHRRQDGGEPPGQHRLARPQTAEHQQVMSQHLHPLRVRLDLRGKLRP
jgi:hypothetical protein